MDNLSSTPKKKVTKVEEVVKVEEVIQEVKAPEDFTEIFNLVAQLKQKFEASYEYSPHNKKYSMIVYCDDIVRSLKSL